ncbi:hypothetical protein F4802DRAFT_518312 [Xylaria palmicola]|nr:hypothetical protein F4802DRAFT_518312 [Xylaria palmicola]
MSQYIDNYSLYEHDGIYLPERRCSSEWSASPSAGTPMTREASGESAITTYSDLVRTPSSEYGAFDPIWPSILVVNHDPLWTSMPDASQEITTSPASYNPTYMSDAVGYNGSNEDNYGTGGQDAWWEYYDFVAIVEPGQQPYWRLKQGLEPTAQRPITRPAEDTSTTVPHSPTNEGMYVCLEKDCTKNFRRKADLERHYSQVHTLREHKSKYPCDWKKCQRAKAPFHRRDHQRDHYRDFHHEDLMRRGSSGREDQNWWESRVVNPDWWRCARCLVRVRVDDYGYGCPKCRTSCEADRQYHRSR